MAMADTLAITKLKSTARTHELFFPPPLAPQINFTASWYF